MQLMKNYFVVWLTGERRLALFPARTIVRDPHNSESPTRREQDFSLSELSFRSSCAVSSDNHNTTALLLL